MATRREVNLGILSTAAATTMPATRAFARTPQQAIALPPRAMGGGKSGETRCDPTEVISSTYRVSSRDIPRA
jgi:hypothetical protein